MAGKAPSFDEIIQADRQKKKQEELANQLLGKKRNLATGSGSGAGKKAQSKTQAAKPGSLASRVGVAKQRSPSAAAQPNKNKSASATTSNRTRGNAGKRDRINADQVRGAVNAANGQVHTSHGTNLRKGRSTGGLGGSNLTIKGASGPFIVVGRNFAPGTTAADIQSALEPITGPMLSCRITSSHPIVVAEFAYGDKTSAELVVANFHNQRADGRLLTMTLKSATSTPTHNQHDTFSALRAQADQERMRARGGLKIDLLDQTQGHAQTGLYSDEMMVDAPARNQKKQNQRTWRRGRQTAKLET